MKIILTIKAFLNYLYNNLIDLVWIKVLKFSDGTELTTAPTSFELFDIKIMSERISQKDWSCISYPTQNKLNKADVPTVYDFIKEKYDNVDGAMSEFTAGTNSMFSIYFNPLDNYYYYQRRTSTYESKIYRSKHLDFSNEEYCFDCTPHYDESKFSLCIINGKTYFFTTGKTMYATSYTLKIYDSSYNIIYTTTDFENNYFFVYKNKAYNKDIPYNTIRCIEISENDEVNIYNIPMPMSAAHDNYVIHNDKIYTTINSVSSNKGIVYIIDLNEPTSYTQFTYYTESYPATITAQFCFIHNDKVYIMTARNYQSQLDVWEINENSSTKISSLANISNIRYLTQNSNVIAINCEIYNVTNYAVITTSDLVNFNNTNQVSISRNPSIFLFENDEFVIKVTADTFVYSGYQLTVYTDTINGIDIKYYKNGDWKICTPEIAVGNDDNLQAVYEYLGYLNYWWIDITNEQITLQRNSNMWTYMYVGDDYEDDELPNGSYIPYATKQDAGNGGHTVIFKFTGNSGSTLDTQISLGNSCVIFKNGNKLSIVDDYTINGTVITFLTPLITSDKIEVMYGDITSIDLSQFKQKPQTIEINTASITIDNVLANKNYVLSNNAITDITLTDCETSMEETTIQFTTGSSAPTLTDNSGLVWFGGIPTLQANTTYVIVIFNKQAFYQEQGA